MFQKDIDHFRMTPICCIVKSCPTILKVLVYLTLNKYKILDWFKLKAFADEKLNMTN